MTIEANEPTTAEKLMLIDEHFDNDEASDLLMHLLQAQLNFYQIKDFRAHARLGRKDETAQRQIAELRETIKRYQAIVSESKSESRPLTIRAEVHLLTGDSAGVNMG